MFQNTQMLSIMVLCLSLWVLSAIAWLLLQPPQSRDVRVIQHEIEEHTALQNEAREAMNKSKELQIRKKIKALLEEKNMAGALAGLTVPDFEIRLENMRREDVHISALEMKLAVYSEMNELQAEHAEGALEKIWTHLRWKVSLFVRKVHKYFFCL
jgi:hypothetical protein